MPKSPTPTPDDPASRAGEIVLYQTEDGRTRVECRFVDETLWLSQALIAELFQKDVRTVNEHLKNIYEEGEIDAQATIRKFRIVRREGSRDVEREIEHYNLDAILAVGYRVRSERGTQFRRWATERLSEYLVKGFTMDDQRLKNPPVEGSGVPDYFDELLERIRDIRASERRMYLRVRELNTSKFHIPVLTLPRTRQKNRPETPIPGTALRPVNPRCSNVCRSRKFLSQACDRPVARSGIRFPRRNRFTTICPVASITYVLLPLTRMLPSTPVTYVFFTPHRIVTRQWRPLPGPRHS